MTCNKPVKLQSVVELCVWELEYQWDKCVWERHVYTTVYYFWGCRKLFLFYLTALLKCNIFFQRIKFFSKFWVFSKVKVSWKFLEKKNPTTTVHVVLTTFPLHYLYQGTQDSGMDIFLYVRVCMCVLLYRSMCLRQRGLRVRVQRRVGGWWWWWWGG